MADKDNVLPLPPSGRSLESSCSPADHLRSGNPTRPVIDDAAVEKASRIFRALGDAARLRLVTHLADKAACVSELALSETETIATISQRLRVLRADNIVRRRRDGKHMLYFLADRHMYDLVLNGLAHASEGVSPNKAPSFPEKDIIMAVAHEVHENHTHTHGPDCGHTAIRHDDHVDYLHDGHLHSKHDGHIDEHALAVTPTNPTECTDGHTCEGHDASHTHGANCGHEAVPHGDHVDYLVDGHLHFPDSGHCDNHGPVQIVG